MLTFPIVSLSDSPAEGKTVDTEYPTEINESRTPGIEQRNGLSVLPRFRVELRWDKGEDALARVNALWDFWRQTRGPLLPFAYFDFDAVRVWTRIYVGLGTGAQTVFDLPSKDATSVTVYVAGTPTAGTFAAGAGSNGGDRFTFGAAPALNAVIDVSFTGRIKIPMRFDHQNLTYAQFSVQLYEVGLRLISVKGET